MFDRLELLIGKDKLDLISNKNILIVGIGGVGGICATALVRSGINKITAIDFDDVDISNINRQEVAYLSTVGKPKVEVMDKMLHDINNEVNYNGIKLFLDINNIKELFDNNRFDYVIDACDSIITKEALIKECLDRDIKIISSCGTGNRLHPEMLKIVPLSKTSGDPIARILRKWAKDNRINKKIMVLCSDEVPIRKGTVVASNSFVPPSAGLLIASYVINDIIN